MVRRLARHHRSIVFKLFNEKSSAQDSRYPSCTSLTMFPHSPPDLTTCHSSRRFCAGNLLFPAPFGTHRNLFSLQLSTGPGDGNSKKRRKKQTRRCPE